MSARDEAIATAFQRCGLDREHVKVATSLFALEFDRVDQTAEPLQSTVEKWLLNSEAGKLFDRNQIGRMLRDALENEFGVAVGTIAVKRS